MQLSGLQKLTLLDFPGKMACTAFTAGCNFRCPFCHNASLVTGDLAALPKMSESEFFSFLEKRQGILEGVCITGGEPTLQKDILSFIKKINALGFAVKLDTNGARPDVLKEILDSGAVSYVAMDIKNSKAEYPKTVGIENFDITPVLESVNLLKNGKTPFEFRTTVVSGLHTPESIREIGEWIGAVDNYFLQSFVDSGDLICEGFVGFDQKTMQNLLNVIKPLVPSTKIRGI